MNTYESSRTLFERAQQSIPGGVNSPVRAFKSVGGTPVFFEKAKGAYLYDVQGQQYIDYIASWGPMILGHGYEPVVKAIQQQVAQSRHNGRHGEWNIDERDQQAPADEIEARDAPGQKHTESHVYRHAEHYGEQG